MTDYRDKLEEWRDAARRKARELDEKYGLKERVEESARTASDAARRSAARARTEAERLDDEFEVREKARRAAEDAARAARDASEGVRAAGKSVGEKARERAGEVYDEARNYYERASQFYNTSARVTRASSAATVGLFKAYSWARENPGPALAISLSIVGGVRLGTAFPGFDAVLLGSHPHWFTHSALPVWALQQAGQKFDSYLREREELVRNGDLTEAERKRREFERKIVRYIGAPLLGAFSCAAGAALWAQIVQPGSITGAPISWLLGGNPFLDGVWLFANGVVCFQQGYKFFMIALRDQEDAVRIVRELKGLLPPSSAADAAAPPVSA